MIVKINEYIESGILESFVMGSASDAETEELLRLKELHPQIEEALYQVEINFEQIAMNMAIPPTPAIWSKIETEINEIVRTNDFQALSIEAPGRRNNNSRRGRKSDLIDIESTSSHMRVHKLWRWVLAAIFILGKVFLAFAIYFYFANRHSEQRIEELKTELKLEKTRSVPQ
ncbi:hypothetical protein ACSBL2_23035 [Pedobacter sp. AW31-3R]|uniref:hypothetical protein n=1 Tax=Pedobacter sp. AW31-3R TaxID=3445781 RepID=UPI003F9EBF12